MYNINITNNISDWDRVCVWNHHNIFNENEVIMNRAKRLMNILENKPESMLLLCIDKICDYKDIHHDINILTEFVNKYSCNLLFLIPLYNYNQDPQIIVNTDKIKVIYFDSFYEYNGTGMGDTRIKWDKIEKIVLKLYNFNIDIKNT
jgi:hypothetical protein